MGGHYGTNAAPVIYIYATPGTQNPLLQALQQFIAQASARPLPKVYTDGSFAINAPLLDTLALLAHELTKWHSKSATGEYVPPVAGMDALALLIDTPSTHATNAYYQELLGISVSMLLSQKTPVSAFSDCASAITRAHQALSPMSPAVGHLQYGALLVGIRDMSASRQPSSTLT